MQWDASGIECLTSLNWEVLGLIRGIMKFMFQNRRSKLTMKPHSYKVFPLLEIADVSVTVPKNENAIPKSSSSSHHTSKLEDQNSPCSHIHMNCSSLSLETAVTFVTISKKENTIPKPSASFIHDFWEFLLSICNFHPHNLKFHCQNEGMYLAGSICWKRAGEVLGRLNEVDTSLLKEQICDRHCYLIRSWSEDIIELVFESMELHYNNDLYFYHTTKFHVSLNSEFETPSVLNSLWGSSMEGASTSAAY